MQRELFAFIFSIFIMTIFSLNNRFFSKSSSLTIALILSFLGFLVGFALKKYDILFYKLLLLPFIQIGLLAICHLIFKLSFNKSFYLNMRGFHYPKEIESKVSEFEYFLSLFMSVGLVVLTFIIFELIAQ